jgi:integrase
MILNLAIANGWRDTGNPASLRIMRTVLGPLSRKRVHHASMPYADVPGFMTKLEGRKDVPALATRWLVLTATRSSEARYATWREIDRDKRQWRIPGARMKGGVEHIVPLSEQALAVLDAVAPVKGNDFVFIGNSGKAISETACRNLLRDLGVDKTAGTLHGFRSSFRTWCAENGIVDDIAEACLAHSVPDQVVRAYKRTTFFAARVDVMARWGYHIAFG